MTKFKVGIIGSGDISRQYLTNAADVYKDYFTITTCADLYIEKAKERAEQFGIEKYGTPDVIYNDPEIDLVINLTVPMVHEEVTIKCLESGKHVYSEKPLAVSREGIKNIMAAAEKAGKRVGCAPDSFMSAPMQTAKKALEEDWIGKPIGVRAICPMRGNEFARPDCDFYYKKGAGPMFDMAAYYLNVFVSLFGPMEDVSAMAKITFPERTIKVEPRRGEKISVEVPTYVDSTIRFENGLIASFVNSFDIWRLSSPYIEIYGEKGNMILPDPNKYEGDVLIKRMRRERNAEWQVFPQFTEYEKYGRGIGIVDMIRSIESGVPHKASAELAYHVIDTILAIEEAGEQRREVKIQSTVEKPSGLWLTQEEILWK